MLICARKRMSLFQLTLRLDHTLSWRQPVSLSSIHQVLGCGRGYLDLSIFASATRMEEQMGDKLGCMQAEIEPTNGPSSLPLHPTRLVHRASKELKSTLFSPKHAYNEHEDQLVRTAHVSLQHPTTTGSIYLQ